MLGRIRSTVRWGGYWMLYAVSVVGFVLPKREGTWVFGADGGNRFADNSKYLYLHATDRDDIRAIWLTENDETLERLQDAGYEAYHANRPRGIYHTLTAEYVFVSLGRADVAWWATGGARIINLWHGCPLKRLAATRIGDEQSLVDRVIVRIRDSAFHVLVTTAEEFRDIFAAAYEMPRANVPALGYPRNDIFRRQIPDATLGIDAQTHDLISERSSDGPVVAYMPTYRRGFGMEHGEPDGPPIDEDALHDLLTDHDATFLVKLHPHAQQGIDTGAGDRIIDLPDSYDIYPSLRDVDVLVTDYSSVYFDYLHLDRPVVFYPYDLDAYEERPGFYFDYEEVTPGPTPQTFDGFLDALDETLSGVDEYAAERDAVKHRFFDHPDQHAAQVVADYFDQKSS